MQRLWVEIIPNIHSGGFGMIVRKFRCPRCLETNYSTRTVLQKPQLRCHVCSRSITTRHEVIGIWDMYERLEALE